MKFEGWLSIAAGTVILAALLISCNGSSGGSGLFSEAPTAQPPAPPLPASATAYSATIHRTEGGFPHVIANDFGSIGFGTGYAAAEDNVCLIAENLLKYRAQLSEFIGPQDGNLNTDLFYKYLIDTGLYNVEISPELNAQFAGYAAGFNRYLVDTGIDNLPETCRGASWIQHMSAEDVRRVHLTPAFLPRLAVLFSAASPPAAVVDAESDMPAVGTVEYQELIADLNNMARMHDKGSNAVGIGSELTGHDGAILFTNPHLEWGDFTFRFNLMHHVIPGVLNQLGANSWDRAHVGFGTNGDIAWTNTVSASRAQALYELELVPGNPLAYMYDGEQRDIVATDVTVNVLNDDGSLSQESHTFYESHHGLLMGLIFTWGTDSAFALRIADEGARGQQGGAMAMARSSNVRELREALAEFQSTPSINTIAADSSGEVLYGDYSPTPGFTDEQLVDCATPTPVLISFFAPAFFGNSSDCEWNTDSDSAAPGLLGASQQPFLIRRDYVTNSNNSFWLTNPNEPITGIPLVHGDTGTERSARTRSGLRIIQEQIDNSANYNADSLAQQLLDNINEAGVLLADDLATLCTNNPMVTLGADTVDISAACPVLAAWDKKSNLDSRGAHLFREFMRAAVAARTAGTSDRVLPDSLVYAVPYDVNDSVNTPRGLDTTNNPGALEALATAVSVLNDAGMALDAQLGDVQSVTRNGQRIPMHGGEEFEGVFNKMTLGRDGNQYPEVTGSSGTWIMVTELAPDGVVAKGVLTYSLSTNPQSPHFSDMTELFSNKQLVDIPYEVADVEAAAISTVVLSLGTDQCAEDGWQSFQQPAFDDEDSCRNYFVDINADRLVDFVD